MGHFPPTVRSLPHLFPLVRKRAIVILSEAHRRCAERRTYFSQVRSVGILRHPRRGFRIDGSLGRHRCVLQLDPRDVLERLGVQPDEERVFVLADGREVRYPMACARVTIGERTQPTLVVFGELGTEPIVGAFTLEGFGLGVDPVNRRLIRVPGLLKTVA